MLRNKIKNLKQKVLNFVLCAFCLFYALNFIFCASAFAQGDFVYDAKGKRNPIIPLVTPDGRLLKLEEQVDTSVISVEGIIYDQAGISYGIVNGEVVKVGDKISGYQVLKIESKKIIFIKDGQPLEAALKEESNEE